MMGDVTPLAGLGIVLMLAGEVMALRSLHDLKRLFLYSCLAEVGFALIGFSGGGVGALAGGMHIIYQLVMRALVVVAVLPMIRSAGSYRLDALRGAGRVMPVYGIAFGFAVFSILGLSPFKGALSRFFVFYDLMEQGDWLVAGLATVASVISLIYAIRVITTICFEEPETPAILAPGQRFDRNNPDWLLIALAALTAVVNFFPGPVAAVSAFLFRIGSELPEAEGPWPLYAIIPYAGSFAVLALGYVSREARNLGAAALGLLTFAVALLFGPADPVAHLFATLFAGIMLVVTVYSMAYVRRFPNETYFFFVLFLLAGSVMGVATARNLATFYVFWELMTWSSYLLIVHTRSDESLKAGMLYFIVCSAGAYVMHLAVIASGLAVGGFDFSTLAEGLQTIDPVARILISTGFLIGLGVKAGLIPLQRAAVVGEYSPIPPVSVPMAAILTAAGIVGIEKILLGGLGLGNWGWVFGGTLLSLIGFATLLFGEIMAWRQDHLKNMLAYSTIAQVGEMVAVLGLATTLAITGASMHVLAHGMMKSLLFLSVGALIYRAGSDKLSDMSGIGRKMPLTALCLTIGAIAIMGLPPFAGFTGKFIMIYASAEAGMLHVAIAMLLGGIIGAVYYGRLIRVVLFDPLSDAAEGATDPPLLMMLATGTLAAAVVGFGLMPQPLLALASAAASAVSDTMQGSFAPLPALHLVWTLPVSICLTGGVITLLFGQQNRQIAGILASATMALTFLALILQADRFEPLWLGFALIVSGLGVVNLVYSIGYFAKHDHKTWRFMGLMVLMIAGLIGMAGSDNLFSFFFFWEVMSSWTLWLAIIHEETEDALREGFKYFMFNVVGAAFLFLGVAILGSAAGTFEFAGLREGLAGASTSTLVVGAGCALAGFAMKAAMLTLRVDYQMHPATAPTPVSGYISAALLKCGPVGAFYMVTVLGGPVAIARTAGTGVVEVLGYALAVIGAVTALYAGLMALVQVGIKRLLIFSTVSQLGYIMCGLALGDSLSTAGALAHLMNHALLKDTLFLAAGAILAQQHVTNLDEISGAGRRMPWTFAFFAIAGLSLSGVPPLNGLASKWMLYQGALVSGHPFLALLLMAASLTTLAAVLKFIHAGFFGHPTPAGDALREAPLVMLIPMGVLIGGIVILSLFPGLVLVPVAAIQDSLGIEPVAATLTGGLPGPYGWNPRLVLLPLLALSGIGALVLMANRSSIRRTHTHTCGSAPDPARMRMPASSLYSSPARLIRHLIVPGGGPA